MQLRSVDLADWRAEDPARRARFRDELGAGLEDIGFVCVERAPLPDGLLERAYAEARALFQLPAATKLRYEQAADGRQRGYTPFGIEHAKDRATADLKEFWQVGRPRVPGTPSATLPANIDPDAVPGAADTFDALFAALDGIATELLEAVAQHLGLPPDTLAAMTRDASSVLRVIHYPPLPDDVPSDAVRAAAHEDINLMTLLPVATAAGLELLTRDGGWVAVDAAPGSLIVDTGDMMALLTGGRLPATTHRVVNPTAADEARRSRFSMPFFVHPRAEVSLAPLDGSGDGPLAGEFLMERLVAIGVASDALSPPR